MILIAVPGSKIVFAIGAFIDALFLVPFIWVWKDPENTNARKTLFWVSLVNWIVVLVAYTALWFLIIVISTASTHSSSNVPNWYLYTVAGIYVIYFICMYFGLNGLWNFYSEKKEVKKVGLRDSLL